MSSISRTRHNAVDRTFCDAIKDGPSAGLAIAVALVSLLTKRVARRDVALTGELTLNGRILPVGGVRGKILAARRAGIKKVILPLRNAAEARAFPEDIATSMEIITTDDFEEIVGLALY